MVSGSQVLIMTRKMLWQELLEPEASANPCGRDGSPFYRDRRTYRIEQVFHKFWQHTSSPSPTPHADRLVVFSLFCFHPWFINRNCYLQVKELASQVDLNEKFDASVNPQHAGITPLALACALNKIQMTQVPNS